MRGRPDGSNMTPPSPRRFVIDMYSSRYHLWCMPEEVTERIRAALPPGGLLVVGAAEGVSDLLRDFQRIEPWLFRKPVSH